MDWKNKTKKNKKRLKEVPEIISNTLVNRGIDTSAKLEKFLNPKITDIYDPFLMPDMEEAIERILLAKKRKEKIVIYGDYDADGVTATSILWDFLYRHLKVDVIPYIPSRFTEGYGLNEEALKELQSQDVKLIITVDCGVRDKEIINKFSSIDFIITDHHTLPEDEEFDYPVIHPRRRDSKYPFPDISGAAVAWKLIDAIVRHTGQSEADFMQYIDLVSIGTICDVMPLIDENRVIVKLGLERISQSTNVGLQTLVKKLGLSSKNINTYDVGFIIGPRINAAGRLDSALNAVRLFSTKSIQKAEEYIETLNELNTERQNLTIETLTQAEKTLQVELKDKKLLFVYSEGWNEGVIGLVAGRLCEKYNRPAICATIQNDIVVASARSISSFNITEALRRNSKLLTRYGGHVQAAGFSLNYKNIETLKSMLEAIAEEEITEEDMSKRVNIDDEIELSDVTLELIEWLEKLEPYGFGNPTPVFQINNLKILGKQSLGQSRQHMKLNLTDEKLRHLEVVGFNMDQDLQKELSIGDYTDVVGNLASNKWNGNISIQMKLKDVRIH